MESQLNPNAAVFIPLSPTGSNNHLNNIEHPFNENLTQEEFFNKGDVMSSSFIAHQVQPADVDSPSSPTTNGPGMDEVLLAHSPTKGGIPMDNVFVPTQIEFDQEVKERPGELDVSDDGTSPLPDIVNGTTEQNFATQIKFQNGGGEMESTEPKNLNPFLKEINDLCVPEEKGKNIFSPDIFAEDLSGRLNNGTFFTSTEDPSQTLQPGTGPEKLCSPLEHQDMTFPHSTPLESSRGHSMPPFSPPEHSLSPEAAEFKPTFPDESAESVIVDEKSVIAREQLQACEDESEVSSVSGHALSPTLVEIQQQMPDYLESHFETPGLSSKEEGFTSDEVIPKEVQSSSLCQSNNFVSNMEDELLTLAPTDTVAASDTQIEDRVGYPGISDEVMSQNAFNERVQSPASADGALSPAPADGALSPMPADLAAPFSPTPTDGALSPAPAEFGAAFSPTPGGDEVAFSTLDDVAFSPTPAADVMALSPTPAAEIVMALSPTPAADVKTFSPTPAVDDVAFPPTPKADVRAFSPTLADDVRAFSPTPADNVMAFSPTPADNVMAFSPTPAADVMALSPTPASTAPVEDAVSPLPKDVEYSAPVDEFLRSPAPSKESLVSPSVEVRIQSPAPEDISLVCADEQAPSPGPLKIVDDSVASLLEAGEVTFGESSTKEPLVTKEEVPLVQESARLPEEAASPAVSVGTAVTAAAVAGATAATAAAVKASKTDSKKTTKAPILKPRSTAGTKPPTKTTPKPAAPAPSAARKPVPPVPAVRAVPKTTTATKTTTAPKPASRLGASKPSTTTSSNTSATTAKSVPDKKPLTNGTAKRLENVTTRTAAKPLPRPATAPVKTSAPTRPPSTTSVASKTASAPIRPPTTVKKVPSTLGTVMSSSAATKPKPTTIAEKPKSTPGLASKARPASASAAATTKSSSLSKPTDKQTKETTNKTLSSTRSNMLKSSTTARSTGAARPASTRTATKSKPPTTNTTTPPVQTKPPPIKKPTANKVPLTNGKAPEVTPAVAPVENGVAHDPIVEKNEINVIESMVIENQLAG